MFKADDFIPTRRAVLGGLAASTLVANRARAALADADIVIVGAGAAAIGAASVLRGTGLTYTIVEADRRIGGRALTDTTTFRNARRRPIPFDIGCAWIHRGQADNPMRVWADKLGYVYREHDLGVQALFYGRKRYSEAAVALAEADGNGLIKRIDAAGKRDVPANTIVPDWRIPMDAAATEVGPMDAAVDICAVSTRDHAEMADYDPNLLVEQGYGTLVDAVAHTVGMPDVTVTGTSVSRIRHDGKSVLVDVAGDRPGTIAARAVIVTVSIGVLKSGGIAFEPGLSADYETALNGLDMGLLAKIPLLVPGVRHDINGIKPYDNVIDEFPRPQLDEQCGQPDIYFLAWPWNTDLMVGFVGGAFAWDLSLRKNAQREAIDFATQRLGDIFGTNMKRKVKTGLLTPWATNKFTFGAYSAATPGHFACRDMLRQPFDGRIHFAGEAVAEHGMYSTCSGAYLSGISVARNVIASLGASSR